VGMIPRQDIRS